jgi:hypothetical protein
MWQYIHRLNDECTRVIDVFKKFVAARYFSLPVQRTVHFDSVSFFCSAPLLPPPAPAPAPSGDDRHRPSRHSVPSSPSLAIAGLSSTTRRHCPRSRPLLASPAHPCPMPSSPSSIVVGLPRMPTPAWPDMSGLGVLMYGQTGSHAAEK